MNELFALLIAWVAATTFTVYWFEYAQVPAKIRWLRFKPFGCEMCLSAWIGGIFAGFSIYIPGALPVIEVIAVMFTAGIVTPKIIKWLQKQPY